MSRKLGIIMKKKDLLLVIDLQNVYLPGEEWACPAMPEAVRNICKILDADVVDQTIFTRFVPPENPEGTWKAYNEENAAINADPYLNDMVEAIKPYLNRGALYDKSAYSSFRIPKLLEAAERADRVLLTGVVAECCVLASMMEAIDNGTKVVYLTDCVAGQSPRNEDCIRKVAESFAPLHTEVMDSETYLREKK